MHNAVEMVDDAERTATDEDTGASLPKVATHCLFILFECERPSAPPSRHSLVDVDVIRFGRGSERSVKRRYENGNWHLEVLLPDPWLSSMHARLTRGIEKWLFEDGPSKNGSFINGERRERALLEDGALLELGHTFFTFRELMVEKNEDLDVIEEPPVPELGTIIPDIRRQYSRLALTAESALSILLTGETGTGKERLARAVHQLSGRTGAFMAINCGALASSVLEAELFGVKKGAFTGAENDREGLIRSANGGTLFLDEIGELPLASQATFLRVLQEREVVPVGGTHPIKVDFRLISATNRDLSVQVAKHLFRADLLSRISGFGVRVAALRKRREDLALLVPALLARHAKKRAEPQRFTPPAVRALLLYDWPMNIRELEKCLEAAAVLAQGAPVEVDDLPEALQGEVSPEPDVSRAPASDTPPQRASGLTAREEKVRETLVGLLRRHRGNVSEVARAMGKGRTHVRRWIKRLELDADSFRGD